jgi:hypothetical protein
VRSDQNGGGDVGFTNTHVPVSFQRRPKTEWGGYSDVPVTARQFHRAYFVTFRIAGLPERLVFFPFARPFAVSDTLCKPRTWAIAGLARGLRAPGRCDTSFAMSLNETELTQAELRDFRRLAGFMVPASAEYGVPGADDEAIFADIVGSLGRDRSTVREALAMLREIAALGDAQVDAVAMKLLGRESPVITALGRAVLQCYYRDDRVFRALGLELRPPYPQGRVLEQGDWSLLDAVRGRPRMWRDVDGAGR